MSRLGKTAAWMILAFLIEATVLPHWFAVRWIPQVSLLILIFGGLKMGVRAGVTLGFTIGCLHAFFGALPAGTLIGIYAALGLAAGASKNFVFLESPLAHWVVPGLFGLLLELVFFFLMPWDDAPYGLSDYVAMVRASNLLITAIFSGFIYGWYDRQLNSSSRRS